MRHLSVFVFVLLPQLGSAREIGIHLSIILVEPGDAALRRNRHQRCRQPLTPLLPTAADVAATVRHYCCRRRSLPPPPPTATAAAVGSSCHHLRPLPPPPTIVSNR